MYLHLVCQRQKTRILWEFQHGSVFCITTSRAFEYYFSINLAAIAGHLEGEMILGKKYHWFLPWALAVGIGFQAAAARPAQNPNPVSRQKTSAAEPPSNKLDTAAIRKYYLDGDFDIAIESIEDALKYGGPFNHQDSIFILKHLGVMHSAKYETREKGKRYFMELLAVEPTAKILDMYASDMIYMIFKNIRDEFETRHPDRFKNPNKRPEPQPVATDPKTGKKSRAWMGWTAGALAGGALVTLYLLNQEPAPKTAEYVSND